jgi:hypothetical protein
MRIIVGGHPGHCEEEPPPLDANQESAQLQQSNFSQLSIQLPQPTRPVNNLAPATNSHPSATPSFELKVDDMGK